ncbi:MAG: starch-binding protein [Alistipes sp.]|nr:starch-binding protein [Alistipes sp.]
MKKFWNLMLAALVIIGAAACTENYESIEKAEGFSFYAEIVNDTRATIADEDGDKTWETKWELGDKLYVNDTYEFVCTDVEKGRFTCYDDAVAELAGTAVTITTDGKHHSLQGAKAFYTTAAVENFGEGKVALQALTSFFRFTYNGTGDVKLTLSESLFRTEEGTAVNEITVSGNGEQFVAFWPNGAEVKLTFSANGETKEVSKAFDAGMVYNLGDRTPVYKVYVYKYNTDWSNVYMYMWDDLETFIFGVWPGSTAAAKETINGYEYMVWTIPTQHNGKTVSMILNNNSGSQTADFNLGVINEDKYVILNSGIADFIKDANNPEPEIPVETHKIYVYKHNNTWTTLNLYSWDSVTQATYTGAWPGSKTTVTEVINGYTYYVWEMPAAATGRAVRMILNNGSSQTGDSDPYTLDKDLYIRLNGAAIQEIDDINNPEPTVAAQPRKVYATTTLSWSKMNIYAWGGGASFSWPGTQMSTETINGTKYYVYTFDASFDGATLSGVIFNNGSSQTIDITNVKLDQDRFFRVLSTQSSGKYKYEAIADPR